MTSEIARRGNDPGERTGGCAPHSTKRNPPSAASLGGGAQIGASKTLARSPACTAVSQNGVGTWRSRPLDDIERPAFDRTKCMNAVVLHRDAAEGARPGSRHEEIAEGLKLDPPRGPYGRRKLRQPAFVDIARNAVGIGAVERNHHHTRRARHLRGSCHGSIRSLARPVVNARVMRQIGRIHAARSGDFIERFQTDLSVGQITSDFRKSCQAPKQKYFAEHFWKSRIISFAIPAHPRGVSRSSRNVGLGL